MKGFIHNQTGRAKFKAQRPLPPNSKLSFDDAYLTLGEKSGKKKGPAFVKWLKENHFQDEGWVFYKEEGVPYFPKSSKNEEKVDSIGKVPSSETEPARGAGRNLRKKNIRARKSDVTPDAIIKADIPRAKALIEKCTDRATLRKAESLSNHFSQKEEHRRLILRRLEQVY